ncbi:hypothetical protein [Paraburkholderia caribensis]|uniref:hypothetical protein n=1 Tax=Paraburkholderia caribensis TaxID=75105 RepID=UPI00078E2CFD|nr:hypothetical protein [Paraburkholderia caribensis]AMV48522.1 hypothetical protein ATN79_48645 [Paraburkholderia caribensis]
MVNIHREGGSYRLNARSLARELRLNGFVAFTTTRTRQRALAQAIEQLVDDETNTVGLESDSPNECMCVVDVDRCSIHEVLGMVADADLQYEKEQFPES